MIWQKHAFAVTVGAATVWLQLSSFSTCLCVLAICSVIYFACFGSAGGQPSKVMKQDHRREYEKHALVPQRDQSSAPQRTRVEQSFTRRWRSTCCSCIAPEDEENFASISPTLAAQPPRRLPSKDVDSRLKWPTADEQAAVASLLRMLTEAERSQLQREPADVQHLVFLARFVRGLPNLDAALGRLREMLAYRREYMNVIRRSRSRIPKDILDFDLSLIHNGNFWSQCVEFIPQGTSDGCFVELVFVRNVDFDRFLAWPIEEIQELVISALELYTVVLHNQSVSQHRMCQISFVEDACGFPLSMLTNPLLWLRQTRAILPIAKCYPEIVHRAVIFNAPAALVQFVQMFERIGRHLFRSWFPGAMKGQELDFEFKKYDGKLQVLSFGDWSRLASEVSITVLRRWAEAMTHIRGAVPRGIVVTRVASLQRGETVEWLGDLHGSRGQLYALFFTVGVGLHESSVQDVTYGDTRGYLIAPLDGLFVLVLDRSGAWQMAPQVELELTINQAKILS